MYNECCYLSLCEMSAVMWQESLKFLIGVEASQLLPQLLPSLMPVIKQTCEVTHVKSVSIPSLSRAVWGQPPFHTQGERFPPKR